DTTSTVIERGRRRNEAEGLADKIRMVQADACSTGLPAGEADFVWGEDAWCYVADKAALITEATRLVRPGGTIAFTDWVEGPAGMSEQEAERFLRFMKFPSLEDIGGYRRLLEDAGCEVIEASDTERFGPYIDLYRDMVEKQLTYDALRIIGYDLATMEAMAGEFEFLSQLGHERKAAQGRFVARKK
ncbi:MAG: methyltransferase domain-containing protein, partial [Deltaproteobacteria bacterium]